MNCKWKMVTVQDLIDAQMIEEPKDGNHGNIHPKSTDYVTQGIPFIMTNDLVNGRVDYQHCAYISEKQAKTLKKGFSRPGDVLLTHKATIGRTAIVTDDYETIILTPQVTYYRTKKGILNRYLKYYFDCAYFQNILANWAGAGSTRAYLGISAQKKLPILLPPLEIQKKIAKVLSALDDKIELNNQINKNLEEQAKSVFDCIYTKAPATYIGNLIETIECGSRPRGGAEKTGIPSIGAEKIERFGVYDFANEKFISEEYYERMTRGKIISGDVLLYKDGAYTGKVSMALDSYPYIKCAVNEHVFIVRTTASMYQSYLYFCLSRQDVRKQVHTLASSKAAQPGLNQNELKSVSICVPDKITLNNFEIQVAPLMHTIAINALQNKRLSEIRDTLLPKLMSGEIDVDNVEI